MKKRSVSLLVIAICFMLTGCKEKEAGTAQKLIRVSESYNTMKSQINKIEKTSYENLTFENLKYYYFPNIAEYSDIILSPAPLNKSVSETYENMLRCHNLWFSDTYNQNEFIRKMYYREKADGDDISVEEHLKEIQADKVPFGLMGMNQKDAYICFGDKGDFLGMFRGKALQAGKIEHRRAYGFLDDHWKSEKTFYGEAKDADKVSYMLLDEKEYSLKDAYSYFRNTVLQKLSFLSRNTDYDIYFVQTDVYPIESGKYTYGYGYTKKYNGIPLDYMFSGTVYQGTGFAYEGSNAAICGEGDLDYLFLPESETCTKGKKVVKKILSLPDICKILEETYSRQISLDIEKIEFLYQLVPKEGDKLGTAKWRFTGKNTVNGEGIILYADPVTGETEYITYTRK